jgi:hypothetical protein
MKLLTFSVMVDPYGENPPTFPHPRACPLTSKLVASFDGGMPVYYETTFYRLSTNRQRSHWMLWESFGVDETGKLYFIPVAWCPKKGIPAKMAVQELLRGLWLAHKEDGFDRPNCMDRDSINEVGVISAEEFDSLMQEIWP